MENQATEKCKYCRRDLSELEIFEICPCNKSMEEFQKALDRVVDSTEINFSDVQSRKII